MFFTLEGSRRTIRSQFDAMAAMPGTIGERLFVAKPEISAWSPGEHLDHLAKVSASILRQLAKNEPIDVPPIRWIGRAVLETGWIPRGKGRSPEKLRGAVVVQHDLEGSLRELAPMLEAVPARLLRGRPLMKHPLFRGLDATQSMRFLAVHNAHHLRIVRDILGAR